MKELLTEIEKHSDPAPQTTENETNEIEDPTSAEIEAEVGKRAAVITMSLILKLKPDFSKSNFESLIERCKAAM